MGSYRVRPVSTYILCSFEPLHNLHLGISMLVKKFMVKYLSSDSLRTSVSRQGTKALIKI